MSKKLTLLALTALLAVSCADPDRHTVAYGPIICDETTIAKTDAGLVQGYLDGGVYTFKGIQYGTAERFMPPQKPAPYEGVKICRTYGPKCPQTGVTLNWRPRTSDSDFGFNGFIEPMDEANCLVLNVWSKGLNDGRKRPVFFWIHGGGFATGSATELQCYEGRALAEEGDIVVVSLNHRLNILGYLDLRGLGEGYEDCVNVGMQDLVMALEWVRDNIEAFGGDPGNVTIAGQSGGGGKVNTLMAMPSAMGLFHKAIAQSGSWILHNDDERGKALGLSVLDALGIGPDNLDRLADIPYDDLVRAGNVALRKAHAQMFCPTVDGRYVTDPSFDPDASTISRDIPMIIGSNQNEFAYQRAEISDAETMERLVKLVGEEDADSYLADYRKAYPDGRTQDVLNIDLFLRQKAVAMADAKSAIGSKVYMYLFTWKPSSNDLGSVHGMELPFVFHNIAVQREMTGGTKDAYKLSDLISSAWIQFMRTGDPNVKGLPKWEPYTAENGNTLVFDKKCHVLHNHDRELILNHKAAMHW